MKTVECHNGVELIYDDSIEPGDIITTYYKGYWKMVSSEEREDNTPIFNFERFAKADGKLFKPGGKSEACDASYCRKARPAIIESIVKTKKQLDDLNALLLLIE